MIYVTGPSESTNIGVYTLPGWQGTPTLVATVNAYNPTQSASVTNVAVSGSYVVMAQNHAGGPAHIIGLGGIAKNAHNFLFYDFTFGGQDELNWTNVNFAGFSNVMSRLNPALVICKNHNNTAADLWAGYGSFIDYWSNGAPQCDQIHAARYATGNFGSSDSDDNAPIRYWCEVKGRFYYDNYNTMPNYNQMYALGWYQDGGPTNGNVHLWPNTLREGGYLWSEIYAQLGGIPWTHPAFQGAAKNPTFNKFIDMGEAFFGGDISSPNGTNTTLGNTLINDNLEAPFPGALILQGALFANSTLLTGQDLMGDTYWTIDVPGDFHSQGVIDVDGPVTSTNGFASYGATTNVIGSSGITNNGTMDIDATFTGVSVVYTNLNSAYGQSLGTVTVLTEKHLKPGTGLKGSSMAGFTETH
jgi:hypothetical protein